MEARWINLCGDWGISDTAETLYGIIEAMYCRSGHHTLRHVVECLDLYTQVTGKSDSLEFAIWLHDIYYTPGQIGNERRSSDIAGMMLRELDRGELVEPVQKLIRATRDHRAVSPDTALMVDIDLSIFGSNPARYDEYASHIRQEFSFAPDEQYRDGRTTILRGFLGREKIFSTAVMGARFEAQARANLNREIEALAHD